MIQISFFLVIKLSNYYSTTKINESYTNTDSFGSLFEEDIEINITKKKKSNSSNTSNKSNYFIDEFDIDK